MPIGIGSPVARMSTLIVDGNLNMGTNYIVVYDIYPAIGVTGVSIHEHLNADDIREITPGNGVVINHPGNAEQWDAIASDNLRVSDDTEGFWATATWALKKTLTVPSYYRAGSVVRCSIEGMTTDGALQQIRLYKNGIAYGPIRTPTNDGVWNVWSEDVPVTGGDTLELWAYSGAAGAIYYRNLRLYADDTIPNYIKGASW